MRIIPLFVFLVSAASSAAFAGDTETMIASLQDGYIGIQLVHAEKKGSAVISQSSSCITALSTAGIYRLSEGRTFFARLTGREAQVTYGLRLVRVSSETSDDGTVASRYEIKMRPMDDADAGSLSTAERLGEITDGWQVFAAVDVVRTADWSHGSYRLSPGGMAGVSFNGRERHWDQSIAMGHTALTTYTTITHRSFVTLLPRAVKFHVGLRIVEGPPPRLRR